MSQVPPGASVLTLGKRTFERGSPAIMAIVNCTPDSFYSGNRYLTSAAAVAAACEALEAGADIIDVGGVRAGEEGADVSAAQELRRVIPVLETVRAAFPSALLSLDTWRSGVAVEAAAIGLDLVNDTWAGADPDLVHVAVEANAGYVVSHTGGLPPRTDPVAVSYGPDGEAVIDDVLRTLGTGARHAVSVGVSASSVLVDPTFDFGKTTAHSLTLLRQLDQVVGLGFPVLVALSRKDFIGETLGAAAPDRLAGSLAGTAVAAWLGATCFRTHDVRSTRQVADMVASIRGERAPVHELRGQ